ncbi:MAG TPA: Ig-like domain-containing protein [Cyclobacteriaceae bacterium]
MSLPNKSYVSVFKVIIVLAIIDTLFNSCANQGTPTGGPKDTIPPTLLQSIPAQGETNVNTKEITLTFDEYIQARNLRSKLIINPNFESSFKTKIKKNVITLSFENDFKDSTTYIFNFTDGITDITESNSAINLSLAFSTGDFIDSLKLKGNVKELLTNKSVDNAVVGLYFENDSLNIVNSRPRIFTVSDKYGVFNFTNLKDINYNIYAFVDENENFRAEFVTEKHGFISETVNPLNTKDSLSIKVVKIDSRPLEVTNKNQVGPNYQIFFSKYIADIEIIETDSILHPIRYSFLKDNEIVRFYNTSNLKASDSSYLIYAASDSLRNTITDTAYIRFDESKRKNPKLEYTIKPKDNSVVDDNPTFHLTFSKPISTVLFDSLSLEIDSILIDKVDSNQVKLSNNHLSATIYTAINNDSIKNYMVLEKDTSTMVDQLDSLPNKKTKLTKQRKTSKDIDYPSFKLCLKKAAFISIDQDSSEVGCFSYNFKNPENRGVIRGSITTDSPGYFIQLVDDKYNVVESIYNEENYEFNLIKPGNYTIRIVNDDNNDGTFNYPNYLKKIEAEQVIFYDDFIEVRPNWENENINLSF